MRCPKSSPNWCQERDTQLARRRSGGFFKLLRIFKDMSSLSLGRKSEPTPIFTQCNLISHSKPWRVRAHTKLYLPKYWKKRVSQNLQAQKCHLLTDQWKTWNSNLKAQFCYRRNIQHIDMYLKQRNPTSIETQKFRWH